MSDEDEVWAYDEPHESGGNIHVTMTKSQAIAFMKACYPYEYSGDEVAFTEWVNVHWAYKENQTERRRTT